MAYQTIFGPSNFDSKWFEEIATFLNANHLAVSLFVSLQWKWLWFVKTNSGELEIQSLDRSGCRVLHILRPILSMFARPHC